MSDPIDENERNAPVPDDLWGKRNSMVDLDEIERRAKAAEPMVDREKRWFVDGDTVYWQAIWDGSPTTVPQTFIEASIVPGPHTLEFIASVPPETILALVRVARTAQRVASRGMHHRTPNRDEFLPLDVEILAKLADAIGTLKEP